METIDVGFKKFEVTRQAFIVFVAVIISLLAQLMLLVFFINDSTVVQYILFIIYIAIMIPLIVYATNCLATGKCVVLSWAVSFFYVGIAFINVMALLMLSISKNKKNGRSSSKKSSH
jgi:predicted MFS family arabinose efflux permease